MSPRIAVVTLAAGALLLTPALASAASQIRTIARVPYADAALTGDDRYVALSAAASAIRIYDSRRRRVRTLRGACGGVADVDRHRLLIRLRGTGCAPALVGLDRPGSAPRMIDIAPALPPAACPARGASPSCPPGTVVEDYVQLAGDWLLGYASTVTATGPRGSESVVARQIATGERRVLYAGAAAIDAAAGDHAILAIDEPGSEEGEIFADRRSVVRLGSGIASRFPAAELLYSIDRGRALVSDNGAVRRLRLRGLPGRSRARTIRLRRAVRIHDAAANAGAVAWIVQRRSPRRLAINLVVPGSNRRQSINHTPRRPRDDYLCARVLPTRYAVVWSVIPGFCNRTDPITYYTVSRRRG